MSEKIGILGFGVVGKSVLKFLREFNISSEVGVWDKRNLGNEEISLIKNLKAVFFDSSDISLQKFLKSYKKIIISPGVSPNKFLVKKNYKNKFICELDLFSRYFQKKTIAITGTLGKTTIASLLELLINKIPLAQKNNKKLKSIKGGNIGLGMLDLIKKQEEIDLAVIELSSFQLFFNTYYSPDIAIWNNFYSNHLDWHCDLEEYFQAKSKIFEFQKEDQFCIFSSDFITNDLFNKKIKNIKSQICFVTKDLNKTLFNLKKIDLRKVFIFYEKDQNFYLKYFERNKNIFNKKIFNLNVLPNISFKENWFFVLSALYLLKLDLTFLEKELLNGQINFDDEKALQTHRLEFFATINGIDFYNDSKSTVAQATLEAVKKLDCNGSPMILILGGLSKGVSRKSLVDELLKIKNLKKVVYFGKRCEDFSIFDSYSSLQDALNAILQLAQQKDQVIFSPSGSSFDLFDNYIHRGNVFKNLVLSLTK